MARRWSTDNEKTNSPKGRNKPMRTVAIALAALGFAATPVADGVIEVRGSARVGTRPEPRAVVWLEAPNAPPAPATERIVLDQRNLSFSPHVLAVRVGSTVEFPNNDRVFHNVFSFRDGKRFDLGTYPVGTMRRVTFDRPGTSRIFCNIHPNMAAYVVTVDSPYFAMADEAGNFSIKAVPRGSYTYRTWRPGGSTLSGSFNAEEDTPLDVQWP
jgi:plastocyanin